MLRGLRFLWYGYLGRTLEIKSWGSRSFYINMNQNVFCQMKNPTFYPKTVELIVDWQQVESIADSDLQQFFCYARECLAGIFPCSNENSKTVVDEDSAECNMFSQGTVPLRLSKFVSLEIVARYLYDHWPLWIRLAHKLPGFTIYVSACIRQTTVGSINGLKK